MAIYVDIENVQTGEPEVRGFWYALNRYQPEPTGEVAITLIERGGPFETMDEAAAFAWKRRDQIAGVSPEITEANATAQEPAS
jgi:hypothetical protein